MLAVAIKLDCFARSLAGGAAILLPIRNRTIANRILAGLSLFFFSHFLFLRFLSICVRLSYGTTSKVTTSDSTSGP